MDDTIIMMRMVERLVAVLIGGMSIYLGYRLFLDIPYQRNQDKGELELPGMKVVLSKVGPGIFFAAFGSLILYQSMSEKITVNGYARTDPIEESTQADDVQHFTGAVRKSSDHLSRDRLRALTSIETLNCLHKNIISKEFMNDQKDEIELAFMQSKRALLYSVWDHKEWGDPDQLSNFGVSNSATEQVKKLFDSGECE